MDYTAVKFKVILKNTFFQFVQKILNILQFNFTVNHIL